MNEMNHPAAVDWLRADHRKPMAAHGPWFIHRVRLCRDDPGEPMSDRDSLRPDRPYRLHWPSSTSPTAEGVQASTLSVLILAEELAKLPELLS
jgi:hypothetical protein